MSQLNTKKKLRSVPGWLPHYQHMFSDHIFNLWFITMRLRTDVTNIPSMYLDLSQTQTEEGMTCVDKPYHCLTWISLLKQNISLLTHKLGTMKHVLERSWRYNVSVKFYLECHTWCWLDKRFIPGGEQWRTIELLRWLCERRVAISLRLRRARF